MEGADKLDLVQDTAGLFQQELDVGAVLAHDVGEVAPGIVVGFHIDGHELIQVKEGDTFSFGGHTVTFVEAPMVHWPHMDIGHVIHPHVGTALLAQFGGQGLGGGLGISVHGSLHPDKAAELDALADAIIESMAKEQTGKTQIERRW